MREAERLQAIVRLVGEAGFAAAQDLCVATGASAATLRRDLAKLDADGALRRVRGGAQALAPKPSGLLTSSFHAAKLRNAAQKRAIAKAAAGLNAPGDPIIINAGTTTFQMVEFLGAADLQIVTNSFPMAEALVARTNNRVILPGGEIRREQGIVLSPFDDDGLHRMAAKRMFMGAHAVGPMGVMEGDPLIARAEAKLLARADELVVLVDSSKFRPGGAYAVCALGRVTTLITDPGIPDAARDMLQAAGVSIIVANVAAEGLSVVA
ncbi:MAG: DeoR/GlpR family DNA-binding transcription regulator [Pseudomonadota bacterium]